MKKLADLYDFETVPDILGYLSNLNRVVSLVFLDPIQLEIKTTTEFVRSIPSLRFEAIADGKLVWTAQVLLNPMKQYQCEIDSAMFYITTLRSRVEKYNFHLRRFKAMQVNMKISNSHARA